MVGRLVHEKEISRTGEHFRQGNAGFLAAGEDGYLLENIVSAEKEGPGNSPQHLFQFIMGNTTQFLEYGVIRVKKLKLVLGIVSFGHLMTKSALTPLEGEHPGQNPEQGCLSAS